MSWSIYQGDKESCQDQVKVRFTYTMACTGLGSSQYAHVSPERVDETEPVYPLPNAVVLHSSPEMKVYQHLGKLTHYAVALD